MTNTKQAVAWVKVVALMLFVLAAGCGGGGGGGTPPQTWTIFVYGHGDHNLSQSLYTDLTKMTQATLGISVKLIVATDWNASLTNSQTKVKFPTGTEWFLVNGSGRRTQLSSESEQNFDDPKVLTAAIKKAFTDYPAQRHGVILWDHGGSWDGGFGGDTQDGTINGTGMTAAETADAISAGLSQAGITGTRPLDFLAFDTCLMAGAEVTELMRNLAQVYIANAEIDFGSGWNYQDTLTQLAANTSMTASQFATMELASWETMHKTATTYDTYLRSHVAIDTTKIDAFATAMQDLVTTISKAKTAGTLTNAEALARAIVVANPGYGVTASQKTDIAKYRDLGQYLATLSADTTLGAIATKATTAKQKLEDMQFGRDSGTLRVAPQSGFNIALPEISTIAGVIDNYRSKSAVWNTATAWADFLSDLNSAKSTTLPTFTHVIANGDNPSASAPPKVTINVSTPAAALMTVELVGTYNGTQVNYGTILTKLITTGVDAVGTWTGKSYTVGSLNQRTTTLPWLYTQADLTSDTGNSSLIGAFGKITFGDGTAPTQGALLFRPDQTTADTIAFTDANGNWGADKISDFISEHPSATFTPGLLDSLDDTYIYTGMTAEAIPSAGFPVQATSLPAGEYWLMTTCEDVWGNQLTSLDVATVVTPF